jgi:plasmid stabilization system protein ParE
MKFYFHPLAEEELNKAFEYYNECGSGLGFLFLAEVQATINRIIQHPKAWSKISKNTRRCVTRRFPYGIIYQILEQEIQIIAVMHLHRKPGYWKDRMK